MFDSQSTHFPGDFYYIFYNLSAETFQFFGDVQFSIFSYMTAMLLIQKLWGKYISLKMNKTTRLEKEYLKKYLIFVSPKSKFVQN